MKFPPSRRSLEQGDERGEDEAAMPAQASLAHDEPRDRGDDAVALSPSRSRAFALCGRDCEPEQSRKEEGEAHSAEGRERDELPDQPCTAVVA